VQATTWSDFVARLHDLRGVLGVSGAIVFIAVILLLLLAAALVALYLVLRFGESGIEMFLPFIRESLKALGREATKEHPAIRLERRLHYFFGLIIMVSLAGSLLHSLIPWVNPDTERMLMDAFVTSLVVCVALVPVSPSSAVCVARRFF
jgi:hypothetical protein